MTRPFAFALCADDYAMTPGVSRGILEALDAGALTATSVMTTSPFWPELAAPLRRHVGRADIGLHLNLTLGAPLGPMPTLAPKGRLPDIGTWMRLSRRRSALPDKATDEIALDIAHEIDRQMRRFIDILGVPPDHVDGHQHVHVLAPVAPLVLAALTQRGWRPWLRDSGDRPDRILRRGTSLKKALGLAVLARGFATLARQQGFLTNTGFAGFSPFDPSAAYSRQFRHYLQAPGPAHLVMCHPGYADAHLRALDPVVETREQELRFLLSPAFERSLVDRRAKLQRQGLQHGAEN